MKVLITSGPVYGPLDGNKLVGNRVRGIWANLFARRLAEKGDSVTLLLPDTFTGTADLIPGLAPSANLDIVRHQGYWDYAKKCEAFAATHDAAVMAAAVVNWIPEKPFPGKMPTEGFAEGDVINVPFVLAPRVIDRMKAVNPTLKLIGCKMTIGATEEALLDAAYHVLRRAKCDVVLANDMGTGLHVKRLVYSDRTSVEYADDFPRLFDDLELSLRDRHWGTEEVDEWRHDLSHFGSARVRFDRIVDKYRSQFAIREGEEVSGSLLVRQGASGYLLSPRHKGPDFTSENAVVVKGIDIERRKVLVVAGGRTRPRATMNAPLLIRVSEKFGRGATSSPSVLHLHKTFPGYPTVPYGPPGTDRDNLREIPGPVFNIEGHGFIACLDGLNLVRSKRSRG